MTSVVIEDTMLVWRVTFSLFSFILGACIGSFLNVCIFRIPRNVSVVRPRSFCPHCNRQIPAYLNIPLFSYFLLRARCRFCGSPISPRYFLVEALTAALFLLVWLSYDFGQDPRLFWLTPTPHALLVPVYWLMISGLILGTFVDFERMEIPDRVTLGGIAAGLILSALVPSLHGETTAHVSLLWSLAGLVLGSGVLWILGFFGTIIFRKDAMGLGDVKLLGAIGAFLGCSAVLFTLLISSLVGSVVGITLILMRKKTLQSQIPYGPYLALAAILWVLWGHGWVDYWMHLFMPPLPPPPEIPLPDAMGPLPREIYFGTNAP